MNSNLRTLYHNTKMFFLLLAASRSHILRVPDCDPARTMSSPVLNWTHSTGLVWPDRLWKNNNNTIGQLKTFKSIIYSTVIRYALYWWLDLLSLVRISVFCDTYICIGFTSQANRLLKTPHLTSHKKKNKIPTNSIKLSLWYEGINAKIKLSLIFYTISG